MLAGAVEKNHCSALSAGILVEITPIRLFEIYMSLSEQHMT